MTYQKFIKALLLEASALALEHFRVARSFRKMDGSIVTKVDYAIQKMIQDKILLHFPLDGIIAEELCLNKKADRGNVTWIIDPIDGTYSYSKGLSTWGISIGIVKDFQPFAGFFYMPITKDFFWVEGDSPVYLNNTPVEMKRTINLDRESLLLTQSRLHLKNLYLSPDYPGKVQGYGSNVTHLCYLASGIADAVLIGKTKIWDLAVGMAMMRQNGGSFSSLYSRQPFHLESLLEGNSIQEDMLVGSPETIEMYRDLLGVRSPKDLELIC